ncbi:serine/arginine repetitive matrix protein 1-like [Enhydra lutris kenyoni]|uniref:Serine/arginine repetitive matrix protein 1-like n=1 Tax=Enhydra lutris kenyoni TaxID=391180 RepID=A0A2Y9JUH6_ENHLU|nr:serine/arginine repetitive matrix protein 1-like [Enhydra lutris kenyoni]
MNKGPGGSAGALPRRRAPSAGGGPHARWPPPPRPGSLRTHSPTAPRGTRAPAPPARAPRWPGAEDRGGGAAREQKSLSSPIGGTARAAGLTQPARPHSTAPSGERERPEREGDARAAGRRGAAAGPGSRRTGKKFQDQRHKQLRSSGLTRRTPGPVRRRRPGLDWGGGPGSTPLPKDAPGPAPGPRRCNPIPLGRPPPPGAAAAAGATVSANQPWTAPRSASFREEGRETRRRRSFSDYFSLLLEFRGEGWGRMEKLGAGDVEARKGPGVGLQRMLRPPALALPSRPPPSPPPPGSVARGLGGACSAAAPRARGSRTFQHRRLRRAPSPRRRRRPRDTPPPPPARARGTRPPRRPRAWPPGAPRPLAKGFALGPGWAVGAPTRSRT